VKIIDEAIQVLNKMISELMSGEVQEFTLTDTGFPFLIEKFLNCLIEDCEDV